jgi:hypothetical protein
MSTAPFASTAEKNILRRLHLAARLLCMVFLLGTGAGILAFQGYFSSPGESGGTDGPGAGKEALVAVVVDGKDVETGLIAAEGYLTVKQNCTGCHSPKLITQNHLSRDRWEQTIRWMQKNQNLAQLGDHEAVILDYLSTYYGPQNTGRRKPLEQPKWYVLE